MKLTVNTQALRSMRLPSVEFGTVVKLIKRNPAAPNEYKDRYFIVAIIHRCASGVDERDLYQCVDIANGQAFALHWLDSQAYFAVPMRAEVLVGDTDDLMLDYYEHNNEEGR